MQEPEQHIFVDHARKLVDVRIKGFITPEDATWWGEEVRAAIRTLGTPSGEHVTLYDMSEVQVSPLETVETVKAMFAHPAVRPLWARKVAIVTRSALGRLQMQRLRDARGDIAMFEDRDAAITWLFAA